MFVQSDIYEVAEDRTITITEVPVPRINIFDLAYLKDINGSSSGNANSRGYAHAKGEWIYYTNGSDNDYPYKINLNGSGKAQLNNEASGGVNIVGEWYITTHTKAGIFVKLKLVVLKEHYVVMMW